jgi:hypothetical protein
MIATAADVLVEPTGKTLTRIEKALSEYEPPKQAPYATDKKAHFLDYMAKTCPDDIIPYNICVQATTGLSRKPAANAKDVVAFAKSIGSVREKLLRLYNRDLYILSGVGVRASFNEDDRIQRHKQLRARVVSAHYKADAHAATVDVDKIKNLKAKAGFIESRRTLGSLSESMNKMMKTLQLQPKPEDRKKP